MSDEQETFDTEESASMGAGQVAAAASSNYAAASDAMIEMMRVLGLEAGRYKNCATAHGHFFECIEAAKFNADAAIKRSGYKAQLSEMPTERGLTPNQQAKADILIRQEGQTVREVQTKSSNRPSWLANEMKRSDYEGMQRVVPSDQEEHVRRLARQQADTGNINADGFRDAEKNLSPATQHGDVSSGGTSYKESQQAAKHPRTYAEKMKMRQAGKEFAATTAYAAVAGAVIGGGISAAQELVSVCRDEITIKEAACDVAEDSAIAALRGGAVGGTSVLIRYAAKRCLGGTSLLSKSCVAAAISAGMIETGVSIVRFAQDEIDADELAVQIGEVGFSTASSIFVGEAAAVVLSGTIAPAVAAISGFLIAQFVCQTCISALKEAKLEEAEAAMLSAISAEACEEMKRLRVEFDNSLSKELGFRGVAFDELFDAMDESAVNADYYESIEALSCFAGRLGKTLEYERFQDFDDVMRSDRPLVL